MKRMASRLGRDYREGKRLEGNEKLVVPLDFFPWRRYRLRHGPRRRWAEIRLGHSLPAVSDKMHRSHS